MFQIPHILALRHLGLTRTIKAPTGIIEFELSAATEKLQSRSYGLLSIAKQTNNAKETGRIIGAIGYGFMVETKLESSYGGFVDRFHYEDKPDYSLIGLIKNG